MPLKKRTHEPAAPCANRNLDRQGGVIIRFIARSRPQSRSMHFISSCWPKLLLNGKHFAIIGRFVEQTRRPSSSASPAPTQYSPHFR